MSLRIAHISATFPPYRGGTGNVCLHNARELARRGHDVHIFTAAAPGAPAFERCAAVTVRRLRPIVRAGNAPLLPELPAVLGGFDLLHLHYPFFGGEALTLLAARRRTPLVITYHQDVLLPGPIGLLERALRHTVGRATLRAAARVLFTTRDYGAASYTRALLHGREHTIDELPNGVNIAAFTPGPPNERLRARYSLPDDARIVLLVAGLDRAHAFKGVDVLLAALARLPATAHALIVGDGDLRPAYAARAAAMRLGARVHFAGRVPDEELPDHYRLADVTVLPSVTMGEAFGLVLLESLACGTPVIASALPGVRTVVAHGCDGLLVPPGDAARLAGAIATLLDNEVERRAMGRRGHARVVANYSWSAIGARLERIYEQVLDLCSLR